MITEKEFNNAMRMIAVDAFRQNRVTMSLALEYALKESFMYFMEVTDTKFPIISKSEKDVLEDLKKDIENGKEIKETNDAQVTQRKRNVSPKGDDDV